MTSLPVHLFTPITLFRDLVLMLRVWGLVDEVAREMAIGGVLPLEDDLPSIPNPWQ